MGNKKRKKRSSRPKGPQTADAKLPRVNSGNTKISDDNTLSPVTLNGYSHLPRRKRWTKKTRKLEKKWKFLRKI